MGTWVPRVVESLADAAFTPTSGVLKDPSDRYLNRWVS